MPTVNTLATADKASAVSMHSHNVPVISSSKERQAIYDLALAKINNGKHQEAADDLFALLQLDGNDPEIICRLLTCWRIIHRLDDAIQLGESACKRNPNNSQLWYSLGNVYFYGRDYDKALDAFTRADRLTPHNANTLCNLGITQHKLGKINAAFNTLNKALQYDPCFAIVHDKIGSLMCKNGEVKEGLRFLQRAVRLNPNSVDAHSRLVFWCNYSDKYSRHDLYAESRIWAKKHYKNQIKVAPLSNAAITPNPTKPIDTHPDEDPPILRREVGQVHQLRIGFVSPDLCAHSVSFFVLPLLEQIDRNNYHVTCYSDVRQPDFVSKKIANLADQWCDVTKKSDGQLKTTIIKDNIDILIDLAGHTSNNRLAVFADRVAPVQMSWCGYPGTTGLSTMDYRITDRFVDPATEERTDSENRLYLDNGFLCYQAPDSPPTPMLPPCATHDRFVFGSFNNLGKLSDSVLQTWANILACAPNSHLLIKRKELRDDFARTRLLNRLNQLGVNDNQLTLATSQHAITDHLAMYNRVDIALDSFPYNGTTTTFEALLMGTPVIALLGTTHAGRVSADILSGIGHTQQIARSVDEYVDIACRLAADRDQVVALSKGTRAALNNSHWCDAAAFTKSFTNALNRAFASSKSQHEQH